MAGSAYRVSAQEITIAALGDSLTQGYGLPVQDGFVVQLEDWLKGQGIAAHIINAGVSGDTTAGGLSRVGWTLAPDVDVLIVALGGNDLLRGIPPEVSRSNLDGILAAGRAAGIEMFLVGMEAPPNYGPDFKDAFDGMYRDLADAYQIPLYPTFFEGLLSQGELAEARARYMQPDGIHPNRDGVALIVSHMGPELRALLLPMVE